MHRFSIAVVFVILCSHFVRAQSSSLQDLGGNLALDRLPKGTIYVAKEIVTLDPAKPSTQAVAVVGSRILGTGSLDELKAAVGEQEFRIDETFKDKVIVPGFISQHDHPVLSALTLASKVLSIEEWVLPTGTVPAVKTKPDFLRRLAEAESRLRDPAEPLLSWGYHEAFFGKLTRAELDTVSLTRPILIWGRSRLPIL